jgi:hypothetical protein
VIGRELITGRFPRFSEMHLPAVTRYTLATRAGAAGKYKDDYAPLAQLDRATDYESVGRRFESSRAHHNQGAAVRPLRSPFVC